MLKAGQFIKAKLIEAIDTNQWIVSFQGELLQVRNTTDINFKEGLTLNLRVTKEKPLELQILSQERRTRPKIDFVV